MYLLFSSNKDFMIQGGDPTGTGRGGTSIYGWGYSKIFCAAHAVSDLSM